MATQTIAGRVAQYALLKNSSGAYNTSYPTWSTATNPQNGSFWLKWRQGSMVTPKMDYAFEFEGDGSRGEALGYRKLQYGTAKLICAPRPNEVGMFLAAFSGTGSDTKLAAGQNYAGTITGSVSSAGYQTVAVTTTSGQLWPGQILSVAASGGTAETVVVLNISGTPAAPGNVTAVFQYAHPTAGAALTTSNAPSSGNTHIIQPQLTSNNDFYDIIQQLPSALGSNAYVNYLHNAICNGLNIQVSTSNPVLIFDADWTGIQNTASNPTTGESALYSTGTWTSGGAGGYQAEGPYYFYQTSNVAFPQASLAPAIKDVNLKLEYTLTPSDFQTDTITPLPYIAGNMTITGDVTVLWQDGGIAAQTYFGSNTGTQDAAANVTGAMGLTFANSSTPNYAFSIALPNCAFQSAEFTPDLSGKPIEQKLSFHALRYPAGSGTATPIYSAAVTCSNTSATF